MKSILINQIKTDVKYWDCEIFIGRFSVTVETFDDQICIDDIPIGDHLDLNTIGKLKIHIENTKSLCYENELFKPAIVCDNYVHKYDIEQVTLNITRKNNHEVILNLLVNCKGLRIEIPQ